VGHAALPTIIWATQVKSLKNTALLCSTHIYNVPNVGNISRYVPNRLMTV